MAIVSLKWATLADPNKYPSFQDATGAAPLTPTPTFTSATTSSYTVAITGYDAQFTYTVSASVGSAVRTGGSVTVSGLTANQSSTLTITAANTPRDLSFSASAAFLSLPAAPTIVQTDYTTTGGTVVITNYDASVTYSTTIGTGSTVRIGDTITFSGLVRGQETTLSLIASNSSGNSAQTDLTVSAEPLGEMEAIATFTVPSGGLSEIEFKDIPQDYKHLQLRGIVSTNRATFGQDDIKMQVGNGSIDTASNYSWHSLRGSGASAAADAGSSQSVVFIQGSSGAAGGASMFGALVIDILDYASTSKYKTIRVLRGIDTNGAVNGYAGFVGIDSGLWQSASAIDRIKFDPTQNGASAFAQHSTFALYGIKA